MRFSVPALAIALGGVAFPIAAIAAQPITGKWLTVEGKGLVEIAPCGRALCGRIVRVLKPTAGKPTTDANNPDPTLRTRPIAGMVIVSGLTDGGSMWKGKIYDPTSGKTYDSKVSRNADGTLSVSGCYLIFCQSQTWTPMK